jgi:hypothetical protein
LQITLARQHLRSIGHPYLHRALKERTGKTVNYQVQDHNREHHAAMAIVLTHHARERMGLRGISLPMIEEAVFTPDSTGRGYSDKLLAFKRFPSGVLKVVYAVEGNDHLIISVIWAEEDNDADNL